MRRHLHLLWILSVLAVAPATLQAQPATDTPPREGRGPGDARQFTQRIDRMAERFDRELDEDLQWLRQNQLDAYADKVAAIRQSDAPGKRLLLWQVHRHIQQIRSLKEDGRARAIQDIRLEFEIPGLATACRAATPETLPDLVQRLRAAIEKQFDIRAAVQQAIMESIGRRLEEIQGNLRKQDEVRRDLIEERFKRLTDPNEPLPEPELSLAPGGSFEDRGAQPPPAPPPAERGSEKPPERPEPGERPGPREPRPSRGPLHRMAEELDQRIARDIQWLREKGLAEFADRLVEIRDSDAAAKRMLLWRIDRRIEELRRLPPDDLRQALDEIRLQFSVIKLAKDYRAAAEDQRADLAARLRAALEEQFSARRRAQQAFVEGIQRRLGEIREKVQKQQQFRQELIDRRFAELTDANRPIPEPQLVPPSGPDRD